MANTLEEKISKAEAEHAAKLEKMREEFAVLAMVPESVRENYSVSAFQQVSYGETWITVEARKSYDREGPAIALTVDALRALAQAFPADTMERGKGTFCSFNRSSYFEGERQKRHYTELTSIAPFVLDIDPASFSHRIELEWFSTVNGQQVKVSVRWDVHQMRDVFGAVSVNYDRYKDGEVKTCLGRSFHSAPAMMFGGSSPYVQGWAAGDHKTPGRMTAYWPDSGLTLAMLFDAIEEATTAKA